MSGEVHAGPGVVVSRRSHEQGLRPGFLYHQPPMGRSDSGWSALVGDESAAELDDPAAMVSLPMTELVERWPELGAVFETGDLGSQWRWDDASHRYVRIPS